MKNTISYKHIALSTVLIATFVGCGGTESTHSSSSANKQDQKSSHQVSPYVSQTLAPSDMPPLETIKEQSIKQLRNVAMSIDKKSAEQNDILTVNLKNMPKRYDWIGLFKKEDSSKKENLLTYKWTGDKTVVKIRVANTLHRRYNVELDAGEYELRAFTKGSAYIELAKIPFTLTNADQQETNAKIVIKSQQVITGENIELKLTGATFQEGEWIGIFPKDTPNSWENTWSWTYTEEAVNGELTLEGVPAGNYEIRLFSDEKMNQIASANLIVKADTNANTTIALQKNKYAVDEEFKVDFTGMPGNDADWIGIFEKGAGNTKDDAYDYFETDGQTTGSVAFSVEYEDNFEIRAFHQDNNTPVAIEDVTISNDSQQAVKKVALFADEHDPHNRLLAVDYANMDLIAEIAVEGSKTHHADVVGSVDTAKYILMVPKGSTFINVYDVKTKTLVKKIDLPFNPRSADAYNPAKNLVLLTSSNRPAAVLLDASTWEIVGKAGMNITCDLKFNEHNYHPWYYKNIVYSWKNIDSSELTCVAPDFGGSQISGHPRWLGKRHFAILDRANRLIHVYKLVSKNRNGQWKLKLTDSVRTSTSIHQIIPSGKNDNIYYGMSEGNGNGDGIAPVMYKWKLVNGKLKELNQTPLLTERTITIMKNVDAYDLFTQYWDQYKNAKPHYKYRYPTHFPEKYNTYYPGNQDAYYNNYYDKVKNTIVKDYKEAYTTQVPVEVKQQFNSLGGHNLYISPEVNGKRYLWGAVASGQTFVVDTDSMDITNIVKSDKGAGHVNFQQNGDYAIITNHKSRNVTIANYKTQTFIKNINLPADKFANENIFSVLQSHSPYVTLDDKYFHNSWTDGGVFFRINLQNLTLDNKTLYTGGIPIQGNYFPNYSGD